MSRKGMLVLVVLLISSLLLGACGQATQEPAAATSTTAPTTAPTQAPTKAPAASDTKVAMIMPGSIDDQSWNTGGYNSLMKVKDDLGVEVVYTEKVGVANVEAALRDYASQGYTLVVGHSFNYGDAIKKVAPDYPDVAFAWSQGYPPLPDNVSTYSAPLEQSAYLCGMIGALMSETGKLGYIGGAETPAMVSALGGYMAGAKLVNPDAEVIYTFPGVWDDVEKGRESALAQFAAGVDFLMGRGDGLAEGALEAAKEEGVYCVGDMIDQNDLAPDLLVTSTLWDLSVALEQMLGKAEAGTFTGEVYNLGMADGATDVAPYHGLVPDDIAATVETVRAQIKDGSFTVPVFSAIPTDEELAAAAKPAGFDGGAEATTGDMSGMKVAMIMPGSIDDQSWNTGGYNSLMKVKDDLGVEVVYTEKVGVANVEAALRDYASQGYTLVVGHSFNYGDAIKKVAPDYPDVAFAWSQGYPPLPDNVSTYSAPLEQSAYLCGMIGALMSETGKLGYIGGAETPAMVSALGGYMAGAKLVNPDAEVIYTFPGVWDDVEKGRESALAQFAAGVDFLMGRGDGLAEGALEAAKEEGVYCVGDMIDQNDLAPDLLVTSTLWDLSVALEQMLGKVADGAFAGEVYNLGMADGATDVAPYHGLVPDDIAATVETVRAQIKDGSFTVPVFSAIPTDEELAAAAKPAGFDGGAEATTGDMSGMKVAMIMPGSIDDQSWNTGGYNSLMKVKDDLGVEVVYTEKVGVANVEAALRDYASQGYTLVVGHSFNYGDAIKKVAPDYPDVAFAWSQGYPPLPDNVSTYSAPLEQSAYLCGMIGALMSETGKLGYIGGAETPAMVSALGGYMAGAKLVNPDAEVIYTFPGVWMTWRKAVRVHWRSLRLASTS